MLCTAKTNTFCTVFNCICCICRCIRIGTNFKYTVGTYDDNGKVAIDVTLVNLDNNQTVAQLKYTTSIDVSTVVADNIIIYGCVKGSQNSTTFSFSEPYQSKPDDVKLASNGASKNSDGTITLAGRGVAGAGHLYQVTAVDNSYVAILGDYGVGTYMDFTFKGNNMPTVMYFANEINGNMGNADVTLTPTGGYSSHTSLGYKGMIFTNGFYMENTNGGHDFYRVYGMNRIYRDPILNQYGFKMLIGVHDELIGQCKEEYKEICADRLCEVMKTCVADIVDVPFKCDPSVVRRWYEDEMGYSIQDKLKGLIADGKTEEEAIEILKKKNPEFNDEQFHTLLTIE